jgi:glyoxylase-like metal-dependent hydrolase (beta-lactamase superfamily II)
MALVAYVGAGAPDSSEVTMEPVALKGNVYVSTYGQTKVHSYLSPPDGLMVNTQIVEGRSSVVIFDGQLHLPYAEEVASYIKMIGKPVDRFILSHGHSDHWSGLQVLTERFPAAEVYAIAGVAELIRLRGSKTLERANRLYGDRCDEGHCALTNFGRGCAGNRRGHLRL